ncbi:MAG: dihydrodipicolinate synthase family protein [Burkholderiales bacterium]|nr:dihydrodipicolinate synthase family protein [Burkholderiales bacterium]
MNELALLRHGRIETYRLSGVIPHPARASGGFNRVAYAAAHVVVDPRVDHDPWIASRIDWDATLAYRRHLWGLGFAVAEAMDTAQRGMGLDWPQAFELIRRSIAEARTVPGARLASGAGTDQLDPAMARGVDEVLAAYEEQCSAIEGAGGRVILMASRALARVARSPDDYARVYDDLLRQAAQPVILHWLGDMFDPALAGYWGCATFEEALETVVAIIERRAEKVDGIKISLLDADKEIALRRRLPASVKMFTGDDFNYAELIAGDEHGYSHALLGIFDAIAPAAAAALAALGRGDRAAFERILEPTVALSRHLFRAPTQFYKTGIVFLAYLNGHQNHFTMLGGAQSARSIAHLCELLVLADRAGLIVDPQLAAQRMRALLTVYGVQAT